MGQGLECPVEVKYPYCFLSSVREDECREDGQSLIAQLAHKVDDRVLESVQ